ncbi:MAG: hypothetical protein CVU28_08485 [Betaproteobacteria bacterium HGW-Betaproteobacteria-21]|nr:MAG: hypothetical protein CVU28_08485 [Betaproteobacteria bacterium HGW-Betaproteobacteria-21]
MVAVDPDPLLPPTKPLCAAAPLRNPSGGIGHEQPDGALPFPVEVHLSASVTPAERSQAEAFARDRQGVSLKEGRHTAATALLKALDKQPIAAAAAAAAAENVSDLPLIELPVARMGDTFAVLYSGDGGWRDLDKELAAILQREGLPVVGVDVLRYFWTRRTPEQGARDLARVIHAYRQKWGAKKVVLIGFSFGADVLPAVFNRLSAEDKASVAQMSLLGFSAITDFEVTVSGWLSHGQGDTLPALAEVRRVDAHRVQCFYGEEDEKSACVPIGGGVEVIRTQGSHHFDGDYEALAQHILKGLKSRTTP